MTEKQLIEEYKTLEYWAEGYTKAIWRSGLIGVNGEARDVLEPKRRDLHGLRSAIKDEFAPRIGRKVCERVTS